MTEKKANFLKDVRHEIEMLREHTTEAEKSGSDFHFLILISNSDVSMVN